MTKPEDLHLVKQAQKGSLSAYQTLYMRHLDAIYRYFFFQTKDKFLAEDLGQEVFIKIWKSIDKYDEKKGAFTSWMYRIAHNLLVDYYRGKKTLTLKEGLEASYSEDWLEKLDHSEKIQNVKKALENVSADYKEVIILRFFEDLSVEEVSQIIDKSEENVRVIQHRAIRKLKEILEI
ncbi:RNA polymerase sigma factor [Patescibacteria group bacterium]|nr:RNA polymerase sigma factor [Patescibacteria group bacterium]